MSCPVALKYALQKDDHNNPGLLIRNSDKKIMTFYSKHGSGGSGYFMRVSKNALDIDTWETEVDISSALGSLNSAYANPIQLTGEENEPIYLFWRETVDGGNYGTMCGKSVDGGVNWTSKLLVKNGTQRPYFRAINNGTGRIDFVTTEGHPAAVATSIYHYYYENGNYYKTDGTLIGNDDDLPLDPATDLTLVYDGTTIRGWCWDIVIDSNGYPVIVYAKFPTPETDHRYRYARWTGTEWIDNEICQAGGCLYIDELYYSGGVALDNQNPNIVFASREVDDKYVIFKYVTADNGATWTSTQISNSDLDCIRPFVVRNHGGTFQLCYLEGTYTTYIDYDTVLRLVTP